ncbi:hypothetical protein M378DRAFT_17632 [Amanita muscaria Koide BX008]|uniref:Uncharacterized protein n=1 Tax=Amanita muscaria (strain Koide BX008) TaxID=946122 RepID=A0A0C2W3S6_AMAMK|nr:hypothetical protein M378DRAFT_17632 [Amanita muscaria Koide BX008]
MSNVLKGKSKADPSQKSGIEPPAIRVEEPPRPPNLPREGSFRHKAKETLQNLFSVSYSLDHVKPAIQSPDHPLQIRPSRSRAASRSPFERGKSQEYLPGLGTAANPNVGDKNRSVEIKSDLGESLKPPDRRMGSVDRASEEVVVETEVQSVNLQKSTLDQIAEQTPQDSTRASKRQVPVERTRGEGLSRKDKGKGRDNQAKGLGGAGRLAAMPGHPRQDYGNFGTPEVDDHEISRHHLPDIGASYEQGITQVSTQDVTSQFQGAHHVAIGGNPHFENYRVKNEHHYHGGTYGASLTASIS